MICVYVYTLLTHSTFELHITPIHSIHMYRPKYLLCVCISYIYVYVNIYICIHIYIYTYTKKTHLFLTVSIYLPLYTLDYYTYLCPFRHVCFN